MSRQAVNYWLTILLGFLGGWFCNEGFRHPQRTDPVKSLAAEVEQLKKEVKELQEDRQKTDLDVKMTRALVQDAVDEAKRGKPKGGFGAPGIDFDVVPEATIEFLLDPDGKPSRVRRAMHVPTKPMQYADD